MADIDFSTLWTPAGTVDEDNAPTVIDGVLQHNPASASFPNYTYNATIPVAFDFTKTYVVEVEFVEFPATRSLEFYSQYAADYDAYYNSAWEFIARIDPEDTVDNVYRGIWSPSIFAAAVAAGENYILIDAGAADPVKISRMSITEIDMENSTDVVATNVEVTDPSTIYAITDDSSAPAAPHPPGSLAYYTGYILGPDSLTDGYLGPQQEIGQPVAFLHATMGADFDPSNSMPITADWWDPWKALTFNFEPSNASGVEVFMVIRCAVSGFASTLWFTYDTGDGVYKVFPLRTEEHSGYEVREYIGFLPDDFPLDQVQAGWETNVHWSISGGLYDGPQISYAALRFISAPPAPLTAHHGKRLMKFTTSPTAMVPVTQRSVLSADPIAVDQGTPAIVGTSEVWKDYSDGTYVSLTSNADSVAGTSRLDSVRGTMDQAPAGATFSKAVVRVSAASTGPETNLMMRIQPDDFSGDWWLQTTEFDNALVVPADGQIHDIILTHTDVGTPAQLMTALATKPCSIYVWAATTENLPQYEVTITVYELAIEYDHEVIAEGEPEISEVLVYGPDEGIKHGSTHRGRFAIPSRRQVTAQAQVMGEVDAGYWVQPWCHYWRWDGATMSKAGTSVPIGPPVRITTDWRQVNAKGIVEVSGATHWTLGLRVTGQDPREGYLAPPAGAVVYFECIFVPDNGLDVAEEPYLDGDQSFGIWEDISRRSTSIYGTKPEGAVLGQGLVIEGVI